MKSNIDFKEGADLLHFSESNRIYCTSSFKYIKETQKSHPFTVLKPPRYVRLQMHLTARICLAVQMIFAALTTAHKHYLLIHTLLIIL